MSPAAGPLLPSDRSPVMVPAVIPPATSPVGVVSPDTAAKDAIINWYSGEFAAANAIIDALCNHITQIGACAEYEAVFAAIHRRRLNWIPVLQMQKYFSISDVALELRKAAAAAKNASETEKVSAADEKKSEEVRAEDRKAEKIEEEDDTCNGNGVFSESVEEDSPDSEITDTGSQEAQITLEQSDICDNHEDCCARREQIKMTKGFVAKEPVNVVKGLKMYDDMFTDGEMCKLNEYVDELRAAGQNGQLLGETYVSFNKQVKGSKREQIQLGVPIFGHIKGESESEKNQATIEPIPALLQSVIDHLVQWQIIPESRKPNGCIINYFDEGESSQPYLKPPHLDQPICTLLLSESTLAFGRTIVNDGEGNYKGHLMLSTKQGSVLVMRNNSADMARHAICPSPSKRASLTFYRIRPNADHNHTHKLAPLTQAMTVWQPGFPGPCTMIPNGYQPAMNNNGMVPRWGLIQAPMLTVAPPMRPVVIMNQRKMAQGGGTGVFLPWGVKSKKPAKQLPPRALKNRLLAALPSVDTHVLETMSDPGSESQVI
ncbi:hypothetical protein V2J09_016160 [Rumex salicifolius]